MLSQNGTNHNTFNGTDTVYPACPSDYEPAPIPLPAPTPAWANQLAPYAHSLSWSDSDGCTHALTLRSSTLEALLSDLKLIKAGTGKPRQKQRRNSHRAPQRKSMWCARFIM